LLAFFILLKTVEERHEGSQKHTLFQNSIFSRDKLNMFLSFTIWLPCVETASREATASGLASASLSDTSTAISDSRSTSKSSS
jgi:hypothetical protein